MRPFKSFLADQMEAYVQHRKSLGYKTMPARSHLLKLDDYILKTGAQCAVFFS